MSGNDKAPMALSDVKEALVLLTRFPVRMDDTRGILSAWAWPLAGLAVASAGAVVALFAIWLGLGHYIAAALALGAMAIVTGAMHDDGLADCADGFWGGHEPDRRLEIMKDSHIGTYGVLALILAILVQWQALAALFEKGHVVAPLVVAAMLSRVPMVALMHFMDPARPNGLSGGYGRPPSDTMYLAGLCALIPSVLFAGFSVVPVVVAVGATSGMVGLIAGAKINGQTGDVLGASQKISEIVVYLALAAIWV